MSPWPSAAHHHLPLEGPKGAKALKKLMAGFDRVIVHFHPDVFYANPSTPTSRISTGTALAATFRSGPPVEIRLHEVDRRWASATEQVEASSRSGFVAGQVFEQAARASRAVFKAADEITVHVPEHERMMVDLFGVPADRVHTERFTSAQPVAAGGPRPAAAPRAPQGEVELTVMLDGRPHVLRMGREEHVLDVALDAGLDLPWSCRGGVCCTCRARVMEGAVDMEKNFTLEDWETRQGFVLTCQARPTTERVVVSFDER